MRQILDFILHSARHFAAVPSRVRIGPGRRTVLSLHEAIRKDRGRIPHQGKRERSRRMAKMTRVLGLGRAA
jgi:hypothetical protein